MAQQRFLEAQQRFLDRHGVRADSRFVVVPSIQGDAHVLTTGDGPPVLLLNGIGTPGAMWAPLMARLQGLRLHAVDLPGYGLTDAPARFADDLRHNAVRFLDEVLAGLAIDEAAFIGNSLGSLWINWFALERPGRTSRIVHVGCPALILGTSAPLPMRLLSSRVLGPLLTWIQPPSRAQVEQLGRMVGQHPLEPELVDLLVQTESLDQFRGTFLSSLRRLIRMRGARPGMPLMAEDLADIAAPTLLAWGDHDPFGDVDVGRQVAESLPDGELHVVRGGHAPWLSDADAVGALVRGFFGVD